MNKSPKRTRSTEYRPATRKKRKLALTSPDGASGKRSSHLSQAQLDDIAERFNEAEGIWPVDCILAERGTGAKKKYLLKWEQHPITDETFEPTWVG